MTDNRALWELVEKINAQVSTLRKRTKVQHNYLNPLPGHMELLNQCADELESIAGSVNRVDIDEHADDVAVNAFASAMKEKLAQARAKGRSGWNDKSACSQQLLSDMLRKHVEKGDPRDVANFCMFLYMRGEAILERPVVVGDTTPKVCSWHQCDNEGGAWDTTCGHMFQFTADGPEENNFTHCCFCGGELDEIPWVDAHDETNESMVRGKS